MLFSHTGACKLVNLNALETYSAWENSRHLATLPLVSSRNEVWGTSAEIPYWWRDTTQIWVVLLIGCSKIPSHHDQSEALPRSGVVTRHQFGILRTFREETSGRVAKYRLFSQATLKNTKFVFGAPLKKHKLLWRQRSRVVSTSDSQSGGPGFESRSGDLLDLLLRPEYKSSAMLVNSQLVVFCQLWFLILLCCFWNIRGREPLRVRDLI